VGFLGGEKETRKKIKIKKKSEIQLTQKNREKTHKVDYPSKAIIIIIIIIIMIVIII
jgi:hypothetical protein